MNMKKDSNYKQWLTDLKGKIRQSQIKAAVKVNTELLRLYWDLGQDIVARQMESAWGSGFFEQLSKDLLLDFPDLKGFSVSNLYYIKQFYLFYNQDFSNFQQVVGELAQQPVAELQVVDNKGDTIRQQVVDNSENHLIFQIPWGHHIQIFSKSKSVKEALFYVQKTIENNWSRDTLALQIKSDLYTRQGKAVSNFANTLPSPNSDLAQQTLKDPYVFDFLQLAEDYKERDIENQLVQHITRFLLELGKGFAFVGKQYLLRLNEKEYFIDLLFYHIPMQCYVVVELKNRDFEPEFAGKLNFYLTLVDKTMKRQHENPTIGILMCRGKDNLEVEYALQDIHKPIGVSEFTLDKVLPDNLKSSLPSIEELEEELRRMDELYEKK
jgi:predicted nuclease of restriction endonuclease-like (RecB) superfamily